MLGDVDEGHPRAARRSASLTLDAERPGSMLASIERAREGARTVRDVISAEMWEAINTTALGLRGGGQPGWAAPAGPYLASQYVKERTALIWGVAEPLDAARRGQVLPRRGRPDRDLRHGAAHAAAIALPAGDAQPADGHALILLQAVGGFHAYLRAVTAPPNAHPVARFLLFERAYPDSVAACVDSLHDAFTTADAGPRNSKPVLRVSRLAADLDFQRRALPDGAELTGICKQAQQELARIDQDVAERYFAGAASARPRAAEPRMHFAIRYLTEYRYDAPVTDNLNALRVRPATTSSQRCDEFHTRIEPEARVSRHLDYFGTEVLEFGVPTSHEQLTIDVRARVVTSQPPEAPDGDWESLRERLLHRRRRRVRAAVAGPTGDRRARLARRRRSPPTVRSPPCARSARLIPDRFAYSPGATYVGSSVADLLHLGAGVCQDFAHLVARAAAPQRHRCTLRLRLSVGGARGRRRGLARGRHARLDRGAAAEQRRPRRAGVGERRPHQPPRSAAETHVKIGHGRFYADVPPVKGLYLGGASSDLSSQVTMTRLDPQTSARA